MTLLPRMATSPIACPSCATSRILLSTTRTRSAETYPWPWRARCLARSATGSSTPVPASGAPGTGAGPDVPLGAQPGRVRTSAWAELISVWGGTILPLAAGVNPLAEPERGAAQVLEAAVDRLGGSVAGAGAVEVGQYVGGALLQCPAQLDELDQRL